MKNELEPNLKLIYSDPCEHSNVTYLPRISDVSVLYLPSEGVSTPRLLSWIGKSFAFTIDSAWADEEDWFMQFCGALPSELQN